MTDRTSDERIKWGEGRLLASILQIMEYWQHAAFGGEGENFPSAVMRGLVDGKFLRIVNLDPVTHAIPIVLWEHHEIHEGDHYKVEDVSDLAINQVFDLTFKTPNTTKWTHFEFEINCESETEWYIYEGATQVNPLATLVVPRNNNRNSANVSGNVLRYEKQANLAAANADTNIGGATIISHGIIGAGKNAGFIDRGEEIIMKQNTLYCMRAIANTAGYISFHMKWYEHTSED